MFDTMKLKVLFLLNCESSKYIAKLFSLGIYRIVNIRRHIQLKATINKYVNVHHKPWIVKLIHTKLWLQAKISTCPGQVWIC